MKADATLQSSKVDLRIKIARQGILIAVLMGGAAVGAAVTGRYRRHLARARARLAAVDRRVVSTALGDVEYAERGRGEPVLLVHGIFHGCDGGLMSTGGLLQEPTVHCAVAVRVSRIALAGGCDAGPAG